MTDRDALYRAILNTPEDDTLRLVYADALEESGDPDRAAFVRTHIELSRLPAYDPRAVQLRHHDRAARPDPEWLDALGLPDGFAWASKPFRRGLPGAILARDGTTFLAHADELFLRYPIESLALSVVRLSEAREFAECSWLARLTSLTLVQGAGAQAVAPLLASPLLTRLTELRVGSQLSTTATVTAVVRSPVFRQLTSLGMRNDRRESGNLANTLVGFVNPPAIKKLDMSGNRFTPEALRQLLSPATFHEVVDLDLSDNNLGAEGVAAIAAGDRPNLRALRLVRTRPQEGGVTALAESPFFCELQSLSLGGNHLGPPAALTIAAGATYSLRVLDLSENRIGDRGVIALAESPRLATLVELDLADSQIGDAGAEALAGSPHLEGLIYLNLTGNAIGDRAANRLRARFGDRVALNPE